jgi:selenocysteine-specific translation elongation factor
MDLPEASENLETLRKRFRSTEILPVSAEKGDGIEQLQKKLAQWLSETEDVAPVPADAATESWET